VSDGTRTRDRVDHNQGLVSGQISPQSRLGSGIRVDQSGERRRRYPGRYGSIPVGFGPDSQAWGQKQEAFASRESSTLGELAPVNDDAVLEAEAPIPIVRPVGANV
jgi:hypothetical protein